MTEAQSKRTRLAVWKAILTSVGGTPGYNDTLYQTVRKTAIALGVPIGCCSMPSMTLMMHQIATIIQGSDVVTDIILIGGEGGDAIGGEGGGGVEVE